MNLRTLARGKSCMIRLPNCLALPETTVLAHYRTLSLGSGVGLKPHDIFAAWCCHHCHDLADGRTHLDGWTRDQIRLAHAEGVLRTIKELMKMGAIK